MNQTLLLVDLLHKLSFARPCPKKLRKQRLRALLLWCGVSLSLFAWGGLFDQLLPLLSVKILHDQDGSILVASQVHDGVGIAGDCGTTLTHHELGQVFLLLEMLDAQLLLSSDDLSAQSELLGWTVH